MRKHAGPNINRFYPVALLALAALLLSCDGQTPLEPESTDLEVATLGVKPVLTVNLSTNCVLSDGSYYCGDVSGQPWFNVSACPVGQGTFTKYYCMEKSTGNPSASAVCESGAGRWIRLNATRLTEEPLVCGADQYFSVPSPALGFMVKYTAQGSGYGNEWYGPWDFYGTTAP
jgi:hypothetical protein